MVATLADGQIELSADTDAALVVGPGTAYRYPPDWVAWWGSPEVRTFDQARSNTDGYQFGRDLYGKHGTPLLVQILGDDASDLGDKIDAWKAATALSVADLTIRANLLGRTRRRIGRFRNPGDATSRGRVTTGGFVMNAAARFETSDALTYGDDEHTATVGREVPGSGFTPPFTVPFTLGASTSGAVDVVHAGNAPAPWTARIDGPMTGFTIHHVEFDRRLAFTANGGVDLDDGQWLELDSRRGTALLNGSGGRLDRLTLDSNWWDLGPGSNTFHLAANSGAGLLTISWRDAYLS